MPEATAQLQVPEKVQIKSVEADQKSTINQVGLSVDAFNGDPLGTHNAQPHFERLGFVPDGTTVVSSQAGGGVDVPNTFKSDDNLRHFVDFSGEGAPIRTGHSTELDQAVKQRNEGMLNARNNPKSESTNPFKAAIDWFYDKDKKAA